MLALSDKKGLAYKAYKVKRSTKLVYQGLNATWKNRKAFRQYVDLVAGHLKDASVGAARILPADFLIDEGGVIVDVHRADSPANPHMPYERIEAFIPEGKRCKCDKGDCISPKCRENYAKQTKKEKEVLCGSPGCQENYDRQARRTCIQT